MIDTTDRHILDILQQDARTPNAEIARQVGMAPSATHERLRKLEERGVITGYGVRIAPESVGLGLLAFVHVRADEGVGASDTEQALAAIPEVEELHHVAGEDCFLLKVRAADTAALARLLRERIGEIPTVRSTRTTIVLQTVKAGAPLPLGAPEPAGAAETSRG
ncbi:MAG TPA: Lrp/AsnC family transcriptional regulator [Gemmatimonadaceae bacterium]|nr:Lrp/AsnC family transcriptional regulator [Gemmatimonadaceae bacterium]